VSNEVKQEHRLFVEFWHLHTTRQIDRNEIDFNHLLWFARQLLLSKPEILEVYRRVYRYVLVDEFQDTNPIQFSVLELFVLGIDDKSASKMPLSPVFIFADDWQSIHGFLGAVPIEQITKARQAFHCGEVGLIEDHRTESPALSLFGRILRQSSGTEHETGALGIPLVILANPVEMAKEVDRQVSDWVESGIPLHEIAILGRERKHLSEIERVLTHDFLSVPELQARGLEGNPVFAELLKLSVSQSSRHSRLRQILRDRTLSMVLSEGEEYIRSTLLDLAANYDIRYPTLRLADKARLMANEALLEMNWGRRLRDLCKDRVFVGSLHSAKGLEFRAVAIVHLDQDSFPAWYFVCRHCKDQTSGESQDVVIDRLEEERRVFYVGVTRACEWLALFSASSRFDRYGREHSTPATCLVAPPIWNSLEVRDGRGDRSQVKEIRCTLRDELW
jgi:DNA helicase-2/ATP-dependent DNA helicase PcrA